MLKWRTKQGQSTMEFMVILVVIIAALLVFRKYIVRGFSGRWKGVGDSLGQGRIYDQNKTVECAAQTFFTGNPVRWYDQICFEDNCKEACLRSAREKTACDACLVSCANPICD